MVHNQSINPYFQGNSNTKKNKRILVLSKTKSVVNFMPITSNDLLPDGEFKQILIFYDYEDFCFTRETYKSLRKKCRDI